MPNFLTLLLLALDLAALAVTACFFPASPLWLRGALSVAGIVLLIILYFATVRPIRTLTLGMDLVSSQDFSSRLARVGHPDADRLVEMFNRMMSSLKNERLRQHEQNSFLSLLIEASPMGIMTFDFDGRLTLINRAASALLGITDSSEITGKTIGELAGELAASIATITPGTTAVVRLSDTRIYRCSRLSFMEMGFPRPFIMIESLTDEVHRAEKAAYEKVIRMISHEANNSIAGIKSMLETLADVMSADETMTELIASCHERCVSMSSFITSYADVVKLPDPDLRPCDLNEIIRRQLPFLEATLPAGISLTFSPAQQPAPVMADSVQLEQVLVNIVKNAAESIASASSGGEIVIATGARPSSLTVTDNGPGIAPEAASHLFTPFFTTKPSGQGIGLLCISEILRRHRCRFSLATTAPLTRFSITFPSCPPATLISNGAPAQSAEMSHIHGN